MLSSIRKFSKSFMAKIFIAIIALPFLLWGMGDVFRSGKQNVIVEINKDKISSKEFVNYIQKVQLTNEEIKKFGKSKIFDDVLTNYISEKIIIAYEPVWSIGTGKVPSLNELKRNIDFIKKVVKKYLKSKIKVKILYGGSVDKKSIRNFKRLSELDGFLIGGASKSSKNFIDIIKNFYK